MEDLLNVPIRYITESLQSRNARRFEPIKFYLHTDVVQYVYGDKAS